MSRKVTLANYQGFAGRTMASLGYLAVDGAHMALGFTTEVGELDEAMQKNDLINAREEHGDTLWYLANTCTLYGLSFETTIYTARNEKMIGTFKLHNLVDLFKRELAYKKEMNLISLQTELVLLAQLLMGVEEYFGFTLEDSVQRNIDKLFVRFPDKFSEESALDRNLDAEYKTLEGNGVR